MEETIQDLVWACLPQEARLEIKRSYNYQCRNKEYNRGFNKALENIFGDHNLTSDEEPNELLFVERKKVQEIYRHFSVGHDPTDKDNELSRTS